MDRYGFTPLRMVLPYWPSDLFGEPDSIDEIGLKEYDVQEGDDTLGVTGKLIWFRDISIEVPGIEGLSIVLMNEAEYTIVPFEADILPSFSLRLPDLNVTLQFISDFLQPVRDENGSWVPIISATGQPAPVEVTFNAVGVQVDRDGDFELLMPAGAPQASLGAVQLGSTGLVLEIQGITPYFSRKQEPPSGAAPGFRGIAIDSVTLHFPRDLDIPLDQIDIEGLVIGSGGFSGTIRGTGATTYDPASGSFSGSGAGSIFGIPFAVRELSLEFAQNSLIGSRIEGTLVLPFFDQPVSCEVQLTNDGDFTVGISTDQTLPPGVPTPTSTDDGLFVFTKQDILELKLKTIAFEKKGGVFSIQMGGAITPLFGRLSWPSFEVEALTIDSRGKVSIAGGWIDLPQKKTLDFHGFALEISKLGFGTEDDGTRWIGFSGGLKLCEGLPMSGAVEGLRVNWKGSDVWLEFSGAEVAFEIPDAIEFKGRVAFIEDPKDPDPSLPKTRGFKGGGKLKVIPTGLEIDAQLVIGKNDADPSYTFFYIFVDTQLPAGIPLGNSGVAFYGFGGLFGYNMVPKRRSDQPWF